ncbi:hypothetical protein [Aeribacillus alveayuensis]|uniref:SMI1/KNR4 family protein n=1 Tax=Aeribacillus alveayuensis TaxID=279215 RepID=A0ABT9VJP4_9BACI|nr:hypothetical protein [Bacillus alveayuensis]
MNLETFFIHDTSEFIELKNNVNNNFKVKNSLPNKVFQEKYNYFLFEEFDWTMTDDFWKVIQKISVVTNDDYVITGVIDPDPEEFFYNEYNYYNWAKLPLNLTSEQYLSVLDLGPQKNPYDSIQYISETVFWLSSSNKWAIWGDRSYGVCVLGIQDINIIEKLLPILKTWRSIDESVLNWIKINFDNYVIPNDFIDTLTENYLNNNKK